MSERILPVSPLEIARRQKGISLTKLGQAVYVSRQTVRYWETGRSLPDVGTALKVARILGTTVEALWGETPAD